MASARDRLLKFSAVPLTSALTKIADPIMDKNGVKLFKKLLTFMTGNSGNTKRAKVNEGKKKG